MKLLAFDTSSEFLTAGIFDGETLLAHIESPGLTRHSGTLVPALGALFEKSRIKPAELDAVAVGLGPGSFTGLRVGVTTAKMMAYSLKKKIIGIPSLEALAREAAPAEEARIAVALDAHRGNVYAALYEKKGKIFRTLREPVLCRASALGKFLKKASLLAGDTEPKDRSSLRWERRFPGARGVALAALSRAKQKKFSNGRTLKPLYLYPRDCNVIPR
jgi:tRNA threonylcarbamoyladenosine biosynthesis protein TsaB